MRGAMESAVQNERSLLDDSRASTSLTNAGHLLDRMPWLPCTLTLEVPVLGLTIGDLLLLTKGSIIASTCHSTSDVPLRVNRLLIGWTEFEVMDDRLAARITDKL